MALKLYTETQLKNWMGETGRAVIEADELPMVEIISNGIMSRFENVLGRTIEYQADDTEEVIAHGNKLYLCRFPLIGVTSIIPQSSDGTFDSDDDLDTDSYYIDTDNGCILKNSGDFTRSTIYQVVYSGGYNDYQATGDGYTLPDSLVQAHMMQFKYEYNRRNDLGVSGQNSSAGSISVAPYGLLDGVYDLIRPLTRIKMRSA